MRPIPIFFHDSFLCRRRQRRLRNLLPQCQALHPILRGVELPSEAASSHGEAVADTVTSGVLEVELPPQLLAERSVRAAGRAVTRQGGEAAVVEAAAAERIRELTEAGVVVGGEKVTGRARAAGGEVRAAAAVVVLRAADGVCGEVRGLDVGSLQEAAERGLHLGAEAAAHEGGGGAAEEAGLGEGKGGFGA